VSVRIAEEPGRTELSFPTALREEASSGTDEQQQTNQPAINDERPGRELLQNAKQPPDREKRDSRSVNRCSHAHSACKFPINVTVRVNAIKPHLALRWIKPVDAWLCGLLR